MASIIRTDALQNLNTSNIITQTNATTITVGVSGQTTSIPSGASLAVDTIKNTNLSTLITQTNATTITLGYSGSTIAIALGATQTGFGRTGTVNWDTTAKTANFTAVSGEGYFANTSGGAFTMSLPAGSAGAIVSVADYTNSFQTNALTIAPNGSEKINGGAGVIILSTEGQSLTLVYVDGTEGWKSVQDSTTSPVGNNFVAATGGTITCCGNFKIHTFTGPGTFTVSSAGNPAGSNSVDYLVVAGGGARDTDGAPGGGGGAGGYRESKATGAPWTASPLASSTSLPVSITGYPITVGGGGSPSSTGSSAKGSDSVFSTITSTGGGAGGGGAPGVGNSGGSGGGGGAAPAGAGAGGTGNTPPVSPPQGNSGGTSVFGPASFSRGGGGGGATAVGIDGSGSGNGGAGVGTEINPSPSFGTPGPSAPLRYFAGGGGGGAENYSGGTGGVGGGGNGGQWPSCSAMTAGTVNTGGGSGSGYGGATNGGSGIVVIRYKFQ